MDAPSSSPPAVPPPSQPTISPPPPSPSKSPPQPSPSSLSLPNLSAFLSHLTAHLSKTSTLDTTLLTATYTLTLLSHLLPHPLSTSKRPSPLLRLTTSIRPLTSLLSDLRVHLRLWGLIPLLNAAVKLYGREGGPEGGRGNGREGKSQPSTPSPRSYPESARTLLAWTQILSLILFQSLENTAFLASKNVISLHSRKRKSVELWCSRAWMTYTFLELGKLGWEGQARWERKLERERAGKMRRAGEVLKEMPKMEFCTDGVVEIAKSMSSASQERVEQVGAGPDEVDGNLKEEEWEEEEAYWRTWKKNIAVNAAYAPMTVHYSRENPLLADRTIAVLGCVVAWWSFGDAWRSSA